MNVAEAKKAIAALEVFIPEQEGKIVNLTHQLTLSQITVKKLQAKVAQQSLEIERLKREAAAQ